MNHQIQETIVCDSLSKPRFGKSFSDDVDYSTPCSHQWINEMYSWLEAPNSHRPTGYHPLPHVSDCTLILPVSAWGAPAWNLRSKTSVVRGNRSKCDSARFCFLYFVDWLTKGVWYADMKVVVQTLLALTSESTPVLVGHTTNLYTIGDSLQTPNYNFLN
jgi:hypothetical protein